MRFRTPNVFAGGLIALSALYAPGLLQAQLGVGTWVRQPSPATPVDITMMVEACCNGGRRLTYHIKIGNDNTMIKIGRAHV